MEQGGKEGGWYVKKGEIFLEGMNTKHSNLETFWRLNGNVIKTRKTEKSCATILSRKGVDMAAYCSFVFFKTHWNP